MSNRMYWAIVNLLAEVWKAETEWDADNHKISPEQFGRLIRAAEVLSELKDGIAEIDLTD